MERLLNEVSTTERPVYDCEANWDLLTTCNFRCDYCFLRPAELSAKIQVVAEPDEWARAFDATGRRWLIHMTGGEPGLYPGFVDLVALLTRNQIVSFNTNLGHRSIDRIVDTVDPSRVVYVHASVHARERRKHHGVDSFVDRARRLDEAGFAVVVSMVIDPDSLDLWEPARDALADAGLHLVPKIFRGRHRGKWYPRAYDAATRRWIREELDRSGVAYRDLFAKMGEHPTIDIFEDADYIDEGFRSGLFRRYPFRGKLCAAGSRFISMDGSGNVYRCGRKRSLGNLLRGDIRFLRRAEGCDNQYCEYICRKYTSERFTGAPPRLGSGAIAAPSPGHRFDQSDTSE